MPFPYFGDAGRRFREAARDAVREMLLQRDDALRRAACVLLNLPEDADDRVLTCAMFDLWASGRVMRVELVETTMLDQFGTTLWRVSIVPMESDPG